MKTKNKIDTEIEIEDLVEIIPEAVSYLREKGIRCLRCGEPIWGSLRSAAEEKGFSDKEINKFVEDLNELSRK
jgi:methionine synthase II (cobalamin-independent)